MMRRLMILLTALLLCGSVLGQQEPRSDRHAERQLGEDRFVADREVLVSQPVRGDLIAAGGDIDIAAPVSGDTVLAGGDVRFTAESGQDLYAAGGRVSVDGRIAHNARIAGGRVQLGPRSRIGGNASIAGNRVRVLGPIDGYLHAAARRIYIDAPISGALETAAGRIELGANARIGGSFRYPEGAELIRHPAAQVLGPVETFAVRGPEERRERLLGFALAAYAIWILGLVALGVALVGAFPQATAAVGATARARPGLSLLVGFVALLLTPVVIALLISTLIGVPLAVLLGLAYLALLLAGFVMAGAALGELALTRSRSGRPERRGSRFLAAALGILVLGLIPIVPVLGALVVFLALLLGMGAILVQFRRAGAPVMTTAA